MERLVSEDISGHEILNKEQTLLLPQERSIVATKKLIWNASYSTHW